MLRKSLFPLALLALSACGDNGAENSDLADLNRAESDGEREAMVEAVPATDFMDLQLGGRIGDEFKGRLGNEEAAFADIRGYVTCPAGLDPCDPARAPAGTVYTYVLVVYPGEDNQPDTGSGNGPDASDVETADLFRLTSPAHGFTGTAGFAKAEALAAMGPTTDVVITCEDGAIAWTVEAGDGGDQWEQAEPLTFFWQSTLPPDGTSDVYEIFANHTAAHGPGPYPSASEGAMNACLSPAPSTEG